MELAAMTTVEVADYLAGRRFALVPAGSTEQHGPLAPIGCDAAVASAVCLRAAEKTGVVCTPCLHLGMSSSHMAFPGTVSLEPGTMSAVVRDVLVSLAAHGFGEILILNGHGGNRGPCVAGMAEASLKAPGLRSRFMGYWELPGAAEMERKLFGLHSGYHATAAEVSIYMHLNPRFRPDPSSLKRYPPSPEPGAVLDSAEWRRRYPEGPAGVDARMVDADRGASLLDFLVGALAGVITEWEGGRA